mgnify:CR=1 FL=1
MISKARKKNNKSNENIKIDYQKILLVVVVTILILFAIAYLFYINLNKDTSQTIEATVKYVGDNYIIVTNDDNDKDYKFNIDDEYNVGDKLALTIDNINDKLDPIEADLEEVQVLSRVVEFTIHDDKTNNTSQESDTTKEESSNTQANSNNNNTNSNSNSTVGSEDEVINYFKNLDNELDTSKNSSSITSSIKNGFVTIVDFLFYNEPIKGKTFSELSNSAKLSVLKLAVSIDQKVDSYFPGYKETLSDKYNNVKSKVVSKYLDITADICSKNESTCAAAKEGLSDLKKNFSITWSFIKDIAGTGASKLKSWYEVWKDA